MVDRVPVDQPELTFDALMERIERLETMVYGRNASVHSGSTEFVGENSLIVRGSQLVSGLLNVIGRLIVSGLGILEVNGLIDLLGRMRVRGGGGVTVEDGGDIVVDGGAIKAVNVEIRDGKVFIGDVVLDPSANGGSMKFPGGPEVYASGETLALYSVNTGAYIEVGASELKLHGPGLPVITVDANGVRLGGAFKPSTDDVAAWYGENSDGYLVKVSKSVGGPMSRLSWPFPPSMVTSEYGPRDSPGEGASTFHEGLDFGADEGTPIPSAGPGVVVLAGEDGGYGNCVVINHGGGIKTRYAHMQSMPSVSVGETVARRQIIGDVGQTGVSFGAHLHFEVEVDGVKVNPRTKLPEA
ncbi:MAG: Peptidase [Microbacterium sp.]|nr:Peptidase [Microbacterium sp.]